jgi:hypothetical protein
MDLTNSVTIRFRQYRPAFFEGFEDEEGSVSTLEELLALPFIRRWSDREANPGFTRFSVSWPYRDTYPNYHHLMAEINDNKEWWVVAMLRGDHDHPIFQTLPEWHSPRQDAHRKSIA